MTDGTTLVCAHRGYSLRFPENTLLAFEEARKAGADECELDLMLSSDDEIVVMHDATLGRTTNGSGFLADRTVAELRALDASRLFPSTFSDVRIPTLAEVLAWAKPQGMKLALELKDQERPAELIDRVAEALSAADAFDFVTVISFDHLDLAKFKKRAPNARTEAIVSARVADIVGVVQACNADGAAIDWPRAFREDAAALRAAGLTVRLGLPRPDKLAEYWAAGRDPVPSFASWIADGLVTTVSGDDVSFLRRLGR